MIRRILIDAALFVAIFVIAIQGQAIYRKIETKLALESSPVVYSELTPDKEEYAPGELVRFSYDQSNAPLEIIRLKAG